MYEIYVRMALPPRSAGQGRRVRDELFRRLQGNDGQFAIHIFRDEPDLASFLDPFDERRGFHTERHGHLPHSEIGKRPMRDSYLALFNVDRPDDAFAPGNAGLGCVCLAGAYGVALRQSKRRHGEQQGNEDRFE